MTQQKYSEFCALRDEFRQLVEELTLKMPKLAQLQEELRELQGYDDYRLETPVVYNRALDDITKDSQPAFIIVADNPGKNEQRACNQRYLVGQSGKLAQGWFAKELGMDFRTSAILINKTPLHTPKTAELSILRRLAAQKSQAVAAELDSMLAFSQRSMASLAFRMHRCLGSVLWVSGYGELKQGKLFGIWAEEVTRLYASAPPRLRDSVWVFRHFSMNQFAIEYARHGGASTQPLEILSEIGIANRKRILGW